MRRLAVAVIWLVAGAIVAWGVWDGFEPLSWLVFACGVGGVIGTALVLSDDQPSDY